MDKEKIVVILLLATIILSIASIAVTFSLNFNDAESKINNEGSSGNTGNVNFVIAEQSNGDLNEVN